MAAEATLVSGARARGLDPRVAALLDRMVSPLCGFDKSMAFSLRDGLMPRIEVVIPQFAALHRLLGLDRPLSYHIGGYGLRAEEAMMRALGETLERYSHMVISGFREAQMPFVPWREIAASGAFFGPADFRPFTDAQYEREGFPFTRWGDDDPITWIRGTTAANGADVLVPAQAVVVGYVPRQSGGEPWFTAAVTTGSAAHTDPRRALRSALLELIEVDTTMGHWYSGEDARRIVLDSRVQRVADLVARDVPAHGLTYTFHYLRNPDLEAHVVACVVRSPRGEIPACGVGVGADLDLEHAMYKAFLEASAIPHLAMIGLQQSWASPDSVPDDLMAFGDLDQNVAFYALPANAHVIESRFGMDDEVAAADLPPFAAAGVDRDVTHLLGTFARAGKRLAIFDFTTPDISDLGFSIARCYSPDTLSLCLPSYPHLAHPRYRAYGSPKETYPHPYP